MVGCAPAENGSFRNPACTNQSSSEEGKSPASESASAESGTGPGAAEKEGRGLIGKGWALRRAQGSDTSPPVESGSTHFRNQALMVA
jgi:hypothetical protein